MPIKDSANVGGALERLMESEQASTAQLSFDLNFSKSMVNHIKNDIRKMPADVARESIRLYDNPEYIMDIVYEFSDGFTSPVLRGKHIEHHRLASAAHVKREAHTMLLLIEESQLEKPVNTLSTDEREAINQLVDAVIVSRIHHDNLLKQLQVEYRVSVKERLKGIVKRFMAVGWI